MVNPSSVSSAIDFSAAFAARRVGIEVHHHIARCAACRIATCCSVKAVPLVAITF